MKPYMSARGGVGGVSPLWIDRRAEAELHPLLVCDLVATLQNMPTGMNKHNGSLREKSAKIFENALRKVEPLIVTQ